MQWLPSNCICESHSWKKICISFRIPPGSLTARTWKVTESPKKKSSSIHLHFLGSKCEFSGMYGYASRIWFSNQTSGLSKIISTDDWMSGGPVPIIKATIKALGKASGAFQMPSDMKMHSAYFHVGVSKNRGIPKWMVKIMENPMNKWMIWGVILPLFFGNIDVKMSASLIDWWGFRDSIGLYIQNQEVRVTPFAPFILPLFVIFMISLWFVLDGLSPHSEKMNAYILKYSHTHTMCALIVFINYLQHLAATNV